MDNSQAQTKESQGSTTPDQALELLRAGNARFVSDQKLRRDLLSQVRTTAGGQFPFAVVLSCIDSRTSSELIFDQGIGDIFNARVAGNIVNPDILGSIEYACKVAGSKLVLVLGHTGCGAVKGAVDQVELGNITHLLNHIQPAVNQTSTSGERASSNSQFVNDVAAKNVELIIDRILDESKILAEMLASAEIKIVGGMYHVDSGKVDFLEV